jgi:hypothetical protein
MTKDDLNTVVPNEPTPEEPKPIDTEVLKYIVASRVDSLSLEILEISRGGAKTHLIYIVNKVLLADIAAGLQKNFPDSKITVDDDALTIAVDWS